METTTPTLESYAVPFFEELKYLVNQIEGSGHIMCTMAIHNDKFLIWPASTTHHHNYPHGLLIHTTEVVRYAHAMGIAMGLTKAHMDILLTAAVFHDLGKTLEYNLDGSRTRHGDLNGHVSYSASLFLTASDVAGGAKDDNDIYHCILAHHGRKEWGSPVEPKTREAMILHFADMLSCNHSPVKQFG